MTAAGGLPEVGPKCQPAVLLGVEDAHPSKVTGPALGPIGAVETDGLIGSQRGSAINRPRGADVVTNIGSGADDEERTVVGQAPQSSKVDVATVHDVERAGLDRHRIEVSHVAVCSGGYVEESGNGSLQIQPGVQSERGLVVPLIGVTAPTRPPPQPGLPPVSRETARPRGRSFLADTSRCLPGRR